MTIFSRFTLAMICLVLFGGAGYAEWIGLDNAAPGTPPDIAVSMPGPTVTRVSITIHGFWIQELQRDNLTFHRIDLPGEESLRETGKAQLPYLGWLVAVPGTDDPSVQVLNAEFQEIAGITCWPSQQQPTRCGTESLPFTWDASFYQQDTLFPGRMADASHPSILRDLRVSKVSIYPFQYRPSQRTLAVYHRLEFEVRASGDGAITIQAPDPTFDSIYAASILNYSALNVKSPRSASQENYLILTADALQSALTNFIQWKKERGMKVTVLPMSTVGNTVAQIKAAIQSAYNTVATRPTYVLLVGDESSLVPDHRSTSNGNAATDYPYTLLSGEVGDELPDTLIGRLVAASTFEVSLQTDRIIHYEKQPDLDAAWYKKCAGIASNEGSSPSDEDYITSVTNTLLANTYNYRDHWFQGDGTATATNINNGLNDGRSWFTYVGHGSRTSWGSTNTAYGNSQIDLLTNGYKLPVIIDVACLNGQYDNSTAACFAEKWMRAGAVGTPKGAVGILAGTVSVSWDPPAIMAEGIAQHHYSDPVYTFGGSCLAGQLHLLATWSSHSDCIDNLEWYTLFGDPALLWRTDTPANITVAHNAALPIGQATFDVTVTEGATPVAGARVYAVSSAESTVEATAVTDAAGLAQLSFAVAPSQAGTLNITVTGYNLATDIGTATISQATLDGDLDQNGVRNTLDIDILLGYLAGSIAHGEGGFTAPLEKADLNDDSVIDAADATELFRQIS